MEEKIVQLAALLHDIGTIKKLEVDKKVIFPKPLEGLGKDWLKKDYKGAWDDFDGEVERINCSTI